MSCDHYGRVTNITLSSPDDLSNQYPGLRALSENPNVDASNTEEAIKLLNDPTLWEAVTAVQRAWPKWHYQTQSLVLQRLPCGHQWLFLGSHGMQGLHLDNVRYCLSSSPSASAMRLVARC